MLLEDKFDFYVPFLACYFVFSFFLRLASKFWVLIEMKGRLFHCFTCFKLSVSVVLCCTLHLQRGQPMDFLSEMNSLYKTWYWNFKSSIIATCPDHWRPYFMISDSMIGLLVPSRNLLTCTKCSHLTFNVFAGETVLSFGFLNNT